MIGVPFEPQQLRDFRAQFQSDPALCERALALLGQSAPEPEHVVIRTDSESVDLALARALALALNGAVCRMELTGDGGKDL
jgi:hypothetical protein